MSAESPKGLGEDNFYQLYTEELETKLDEMIEPAEWELYKTFDRPDGVHLHPDDPQYMIKVADGRVVDCAHYLGWRECNFADEITAYNQSRSQIGRKGGHRHKP